MDDRLEKITFYVPSDLLSIKFIKVIGFPDLLHVRAWYVIQPSYIAAMNPASLSENVYRGKKFSRHTFPHGTYNIW